MNIDAMTNGVKPQIRPDAPGLRSPESKEPPVARRLLILDRPGSRAGSGVSWSVGAGPGGARLVRGPETGAAATGRDGIRVVDREAGAHQGVDVVDLGPLQQGDALAIDVDPHAVRVEDVVLARWRVLEHHPVAEAGAAAGIDVDAQADVRIGLFLRQLAQLRGRGVAEREDGGLMVNRRLQVDHRLLVDHSSGSLVNGVRAWAALTAPAAMAPIVRTSTDSDNHPSRNRQRGVAPLGKGD